MNTIIEKLLSSPAVLHQIGKERASVLPALLFSEAFPPSYLEFLARYGEVKLFRDGLGYQLIVLPAPTKVDNDDIGSLFQFGSYDDSYCYFYSASMKQGVESPVYAFEDEKLVQVAQDFSEWFSLAATVLLSQQDSLHGKESKATFTEQEQAIIQQRRSYQWHITGRTSSFVTISVTNLSDALLDCFTIGVRSIDRTVNGAVKIEVRDVAPGMSKAINLDCYSYLVHPSLVELFDLPDPTPDTRSMYFELP